jgi:hypothetical protein
LPNVTPNFEGSYLIHKNDSTYIGEGNAKEALKIVKENLPKNIQPAVKGTEDTIEKK